MAESGYKPGNSTPKKKPGAKSVGGVKVKPLDNSFRTELDPGVAVLPHGPGKGGKGRTIDDTVAFVKKKTSGGRIR